jgi:large subunit ribosomal protein L4
MPTADVVDADNQVISQVELDEGIYNGPVKSHLVHQVVRMQLAARRAGTASTKNRALVRGSRKKPWRQKGTGRARAGTRQSPIWRGGGVTFGPSLRDYGFKINRRVRKAALRSALSQKYKDGHLRILDQLEFPEIRTRRMVEIIGNLGLAKALIVIPARDEAVEKSSRNIPYVKVLPVEGLNVYDILRYRDLVILRECLQQIEERMVS